MQRPGESDSISTSQKIAIALEQCASAPPPTTKMQIKNPPSNHSTQEPTTPQHNKNDETAAFFAKLPRELRDAIYKLAYADAKHEAPLRDFKAITLSRWLKNERFRRAAGNAPIRSILRSHVKPTATPIPTCPLNGMIVSKQWFEEAATAFFRMKTICTSDAENFLQIYSEVMKKNILSLDLEWSIGDDWKTFPHLESFGGLRRLRLQVNEQIFNDVVMKLVCVHVFCSEDFARIRGVGALLKHALQVERVSLVPGESRLATSDEEREVWKQNVKGLEEFLGKRLAEKKLGVRRKATEEREMLLMGEEKHRQQKGTKTSLKATGADDQQHGAAAATQQSDHSNPSICKQDSSKAVDNSALPIRGCHTGHEQFPQAARWALGISVVNTVILLGLLSWMSRRR